MRRLLSAGLALAAFAFPLQAGEVELAFHLGRSLPYYEQALRYQPGSVPAPLGLALRLDDSIGLDARGGVSLAGAVTGFVAGPLAFEARIDRATVQFDVKDATFDVVVRGAPAGTPGLASFRAVGTANSDALTPASLNLKLRSKGAIRIYVSGGVSYLPSFEFNASETLTLDRSVLGVSGLSLRLAAGGTLDGGLGLNGGLGLELPLGEHAALVAEARGFVFEERELQWRAGGDRPLSAIEQALVEELLRQLDPVRFRPGFYQATAGVSIRF
jgi:hypothetical protein